MPGNLHYYDPQDHIPSVRDGNVTVVTENVPFGRGYTALNSFSYSGANVHVLLKGHYKPKVKNFLFVTVISWEFNIFIEE